MEHLYRTHQTDYSSPFIWSFDSYDNSFFYNIFLTIFFSIPLYCRTFADAVNIWFVMRKYQELHWNHVELKLFSREQFHFRRRSLCLYFRLVASLNLSIFAFFLHVRHSFFFLAMTKWMNSLHWNIIWFGSI